ncbi:hypothetical protein Q7C_2548 [Methylophaga frappieri]|uniref:ABC3 transporter permease C-terminal domain-containing protein n=1 Tax=Methylophaga frappieri (strain ATCC BAA-2434 / DSM 25690 / JAM7) TaxID=754477 RepID=I1YL76_METFJ|nr:FtsX-like permease family protein [Methylophaga frappieri]AFJ03669.1 hypothetical protein Q7C_2548 [Methylophaga frappieri]
MSRRLLSKGLVQDLRLRQVKVMLSSILIAVATIATINLFAAHLQNTLMQSASSFLAADRQLISRSSEPVPAQWQQSAERIGLKYSQMMQFSTMLSHQDKFQLTTIKAVDARYPLRGELEWQPTITAPRQTIEKGPAEGEIWLNPRLLKLLALDIGDSVQVGQLLVTITGILLREPDSGFRLSSFAPRALMHISDVEKTAVIQPGSRVRHRLLLSGDIDSLTRFEKLLPTDMTAAQLRWRDARDGESLGEALEKAENFLLLGGSLAVLLAVVAIAVSSRQYALQQRDTVALLKSLGLTSSAIRYVYAGRLAIWGSVTTLLGILFALPASAALAALTAAVMAQPFQWHLSLTSLWPALITAMVVLFVFALPPIDRLRQTPAMQVLRSLPEANSRQYWRDALVAVLVITGLLWLFAGDVALIAALIAGLTVLLAVVAGVGWLIMRLLQPLRGGASVMRTALMAMQRHRQATLTQLTVFAITMMLASTLVLVRTSLLADWQAQLPENAPNHFLINIAPDAVEEIDTLLSSADLTRSPMYPVVRARLTEINGQPAAEVATNPRDDELRRELNLTAAADYPPDNRIVAGQWFADNDTQGLSIEASLAESLGVTVGDTLGFSSGSETFTATVTSIRTVQWDSMRPNFFIMFPPAGALAELPATYLTSFYLPVENKSWLNDFVSEFPTVSVLEIDHIIEQIQQIILQVSQAIEALLWMILLAAIAVMVAVTSATLAERQREGALLRTLGAQQRFLRLATVLEFGILGFLSGVIGVLAAEAVVWLLQYRLFESSFSWHAEFLVIMPIVSGLLLAILGYLQLRPVLMVSPMVLLRRLE